MFRAYDIRGLVDDDFTVEAATIIGKGIGSYVQKRWGKRVVVGQDNRPSSEKLKAALVESLKSTGCEVFEIGLSTSPMLYAAVVENNMDAGVNVTASHNPPQYNGFKIVGRDAYPVGGQDIKDLLELTKSGEFLSGPGKSTKLDYLDRYIDAITSRIKPARKLKVAVDTGNGVAGIVMPRLLRALGCEVIEVCTELDGRFPNHIPNPEEEKNLTELKRQVVASGADLGLGVDGDGDRIGLINEKGEFMEADYIIMLLARDFLSRHPGDTILIDVKTSQNTIDFISKYGGKPMMWKTGHSLVKQKMREDGIQLGGELSGHMFVFENYYSFDDAAYAGGKIIEFLSKSETPLSEYFTGLPKLFSTRLVEIKCDDTIKFDVVEKVKNDFLSKYDAITIDGIRINFPNGWALVRASNTSGTLTLRFEAKTEADLEKIRKEVLASVKKYVTVEPD
jgi:phosphomannomutase/phosphoglucomutase